MRTQITITILTLLIVLVGGCKQDSETLVFKSRWSETGNGIWVGPDYWANRLQDWSVINGRLECIQASTNKPMRTVHLLTRRLKAEGSGFNLEVRTGAKSEKIPEDSAVGFLLGVAPAIDYRAAALVHHSYGSGGGMFVGIDGKGKLFIRDRNDNNIILQSDKGISPTKEVRLKLSAAKHNHKFSLTLTCIHGDTGKKLASIRQEGIDMDRLTGGLALVSHPGWPNGNKKGKKGARFWFKNFKVSGDKVAVLEDRNCGPILSSHYTLSNNILKITAQMMPLTRNVKNKVEFQVKEKDNWKTIAVTTIDADAYTARFKINAWETHTDKGFRIKYLLPNISGKEKPYYWTGTIKKNPVDKDRLILAAFTGNHNTARPIKGKWKAMDGERFPFDRCIWFPHNDIVKHVGKHAPDLLFFSGDQIYEGASPTAADIANGRLDYLYKWYLWCWAFRDLTREIPCVMLPDDHDVFHGNVWGAGGIATPVGKRGAAAQDAGGYKMPPSFVNMVQRTQTSHLPDPFDATPVAQNIGVYYCALEYGGVSFAVLEDRKFKSAPGPLLPKAEVWNGWAQAKGFDAKKESDVVGAKLLGERQLEFLRQWAVDWNHDTWMKVVLSQTIFANVATLPVGSKSGSVIPKLELLKPGEYAENDGVVADMDSNGWPQSARNEAVKAMRRGFAIHIAGDQHLGSTIQYGVEQWRDSGFALCVPSIANFWPRRWFPREGGRNRLMGAPLYTGDFEDGFGNKMTVHAVSNPHAYGKEPALLHDLAPGYGFVTLVKSTREIILENWSRYADPKEGGKPYPGWPVKVRQWDNYHSADLFYLPSLDFGNMKRPYPLVRVKAEVTGETVYVIRPWRKTFIPKVFARGKYTMEVGKGGKIYKGLEAQPIKDKKSLSFK